MQIVFITSVFDALFLQYLSTIKETISLSLTVDYVKLNIPSNTVFRHNIVCILALLHVSIFYAV